MWSEFDHFLILVDFLYDFLCKLLISGHISFSGMSNVMMPLWFSLACSDSYSNTIDIVINRKACRVITVSIFLNVQTMAKPVWDLLYISKYRYFSSCFVMVNAAAKILISKETYWNMLYKNFFLDFRHLERSQIRCSKYWGSTWSVKGAIGWFQQKFGQYSLVMLYFYMVFLWLVNWLVFMLYLWLV